MASELTARQYALKQAPAALIQSAKMVVLTFPADEAPGSTKGGGPCVEAA